ncbi:phosphoglycerate mutase family protein [Sporocytophaga myxococcoides]|uniref:Phosphoglycerate mutase family protein n=1 Tax=Sporocytophaga myxococcoides TaxID=153721 RepID=A0A098LBE5_9BACT|nr:histidine phosphatase family protein [Sporocytophaga myxococcoides]GAL83653.1 phosphoglycerate mutase family protein [Sporocytophaga myxococcoides]
MKIGLVRHFKVNHPFPEKTLLSKSDLVKWFAEYDNKVEIQSKVVDLSGVNWHCCYSSPLIRAVKTAKHIYNGNITEIPELKELDIVHRLSDKLKLPFLMWGFIIRMISFTANNDTDRFKNGIIAFVDNVIAKNEKDFLIVSHWFVMRVIRQELIKRGFVGDNFKSNDYGRLYVFEGKTK